jgi:hypothetical protein
MISCENGNGDGMMTTTNISMATCRWGVREYPMNTFTNCPSNINKLTLKTKTTNQSMFIKGEYKYYMIKETIPKNI